MIVNTNANLPSLGSKTLTSQDLWDIGFGLTNPVRIFDTELVIERANEPTLGRSSHPIISESLALGVLIVETEQGLVDPHFLELSRDGHVQLLPLAPQLCVDIPEVLHELGVVFVGLALDQ